MPAPLGWAHGGPDGWAHGGPDGWTHGGPDGWTHGGPDGWAHGGPDGWAHGGPDGWAHGGPDSWAYGGPDSWAYGGPDSWAYGGPDGRTTEFGRLCGSYGSNDGLLGRCQITDQRFLLNRHFHLSCFSNLFDMLRLSIEQVQYQIVASPAHTPNLQSPQILSRCSGEETVIGSRKQTQTWIKNLSMKH